MESGRIWGRGIEWDAVRALLAREARTVMGRERAALASPLTDLAAIRAEIALTREARAALTSSGAPPLESVPDVRPALDRCRAPGAVLDGPDLVQLIPVLDTARALSGWARGVAAVAPTLSARAAALPALADLHITLRRALDDDGAVTDAASRRLAQLRRDVLDRRQRLVRDLERLWDTRDAERILAERYVTVRHGRYVVPVRAESRSRLRGIVHDRSQSGQTLFVEPESAVDANNDLVQLIREEEAEVTRVLAELSDAVRARVDDLDTLIDVIGAVDWIVARGEAAQRMDAVEPDVREARAVAVRAARHPLLLAQSWQDSARPVVPVDLELGDDRPLLLITGPNAGGKTIALKTLALFVLMAQIGCHVPAAEGARLPLVSQLFAIIGDDQSVSENLSTFSAFVKQVREILDAVDDRSLVLLDELGAGTDPDEGAALARAILEELEGRGALVVATTHLEPLKAFASTHPRARNASVEFDGATLAPTFRLRYGQPGPSYALAIAARLGLTAELLARAQSHRTAQQARMSELLAWLDEHTRGEAERTLAIEQREQEAVARLTAAREAESAARARADEVLARARAEAGALVTEIKRSINAEWERLRRPDRSRETLNESRRRVTDAAARLTIVPPATADERTGETIVPGARVRAEHLGVQGEVVAVTGSTATVQSGTVTVRVPLHALRLAAAPAPGATTPSRRDARVTLPDKAAPQPELHLIGRTADEARDLVEQYLDHAFLAGLGRVRLVHGKGTGALRKAVRDLLAGHPLVDSFRDGEPSEGGTGATVAALRVG
ncbi:MAG: endonuclease MutS2 [Candidatus Rokubacteria bacterium]|nr:endonuclease MutS2 [Candidatus Rokubacteria bacterium]